ncbi:acetyl-CoA carboxylase biotin carboxyl carrier protein [Phytohabitans aurantiacus]|jgi:acetyl-CoA carboxylase biotin carboxyl carrier protein|nr:biotin/lipoyl-containing protein [Phytohabitans aurantiacus]
MVTRIDAEAALVAVCQQVSRLSGAGPVPSRMRIQMGEVVVELEWPASGPAEPSRPVAALPGAAAEAAVEERAGWTQVRAPTVGTFYRSPEPGAPPFVRVGDRVQAGQQVGILEAMKLMNAIVATSAGRVTEILVQDGMPVEYDQPLIALAGDGTGQEPA